MKITRKHFIKSPFLAIGENYKPSLIDCFFYTLERISFKDLLICYKYRLKEILTIEFILFPLWLVGILLDLLCLIVSPFVFIFCFITACIGYTTKWGRNRHKAKYNRYTAKKIADYKYRIGWGDL